MFCQPRDPLSRLCMCEVRLDKIVWLPKPNECPQRKKIINTRNFIITLNSHAV